MLLAYGHAGLMSTHQLMSSVCERMYGPRSCDATYHAFLGNSSLGTIVHLLAVLVQVARKDMGCVEWREPSHDQEEKVGVEREEAFGGYRVRGSHQQERRTILKSRRIEHGRILRMGGSPPTPKLRTLRLPILNDGT